MNKNLKIALDIMGGDYAEVVPIEAAIKAHKAGISLILVGNEEIIKNQLKNRSCDVKDFEIADAPEIVKMDEEISTKSLRKKSSLRVCYDLVKEGRAGAVVSAGNSGMMMALGLVILRPIKGIERPCIGVFLPRARKGKFLLADAGANVESSADNIFQFAVLAAVYIETVTGKTNPQICLLNIGEEEYKGTPTIKEAYKKLKNSKLNFAGNLEAKNCFMGNHDALVCDGFHGNLLLKTGEGAEKLFRSLLKEELSNKFIYKLIAPILMPAFKNMKENTNYANSGGGVILGINGISVVCHGNSNVTAIYMALKNARKLLESSFLTKMIKSVDSYQQKLKQ